MSRPEELIADLHETAKSERVERAALVVGYRAHQVAELIWSNDLNCLAKLNAAIANGAKPIGLFVLRRRGETGLDMRSWPLDEYDGEEWVEKLLISVIADVRDTAKVYGGKVGPISG